MSYIIISGRTVDEAIEEGLRQLKTTRDEVEVEVVQAPSKGFLGLIGSKEATVKLTEKVNTKDLVQKILKDEELKDLGTNNDLEDTSEEVQVRSSLKEESIKEEPVLEESPQEAVLEEVPQENRIEESPREEASQLGDKGEGSEEEKKTKIEKIEEFSSLVTSILGLEAQTKIQDHGDHIDVDVLGDEHKMGILIGKRGVTLDAVQYLMTRLVNQDQEDYTRVFLDTSNYRAKREKSLESLAHKSAQKVLKYGRNVRLEAMNAAERRIIHAALQDVDGVMTHSEGRDPHRRVIIQKQRDYE